MMKRKIVRLCSYPLAVAGLFISTTRFAQAKDLSELSGSYQIAQKTELGAQTRVRLQLHLTNHGQQALHIQRLTLWDFPHADKGATQTCSIIVYTGASADTTEEFTIPRAEFELWKHGARPRLVLQIEAPRGQGTTKVVRLDRVSAGKGH
jgi:hypothetical protein